MVPSDDFEIGAVINGYELQGELGVGSFGQVWKVRKQNSDKLFALKRSKNRANSPEVTHVLHTLEQFKDLQNPWLLLPLDWFEYGGRLCIVTELAEGGSLKELLTGLQNDRYQVGQPEGEPALGGIPVQELLGYFGGVAQALDYLHDQKQPIQHRDVKPQNILLVGGYAKLADFDLAPSMLNQRDVTRTRGRSLAYNAPEMFNDQFVHRKSDQYCLAYTYAELRLGRLPFDYRTEKQLRIAHETEKPNLEPLGAGEQDVLLRALAKNPNDRFATCIEFLRALSEAIPQSDLRQDALRIEPTPASSLENQQLLPMAIGGRIGELTQTFDLDKLLEKIGDKLFQAFPQADRALIFLADEANDTLIPKVIKSRRAQDEPSANFGRLIVQQCMTKAQALLSEDAYADQRFDLSRSASTPRISSIVVAPLTMRATGKSFGVIQLDTPDRHNKFTQDDLKLLMSVASQAAIALENAKLHANLVERAGLERDLRFAHQVQSAPQPPLTSPLSSPYGSAGKRESSIPPQAQKMPVLHQPNDENVRFAAYWPKLVQPKKWYDLLAFAYLSERPPNAPDDEPDPIAIVQRQVQQFLGEQSKEYKDATRDSKLAVPREGQIVFVPEVAGMEFNPPSCWFKWQESVHRAEFRFRSVGDLEGKTAQGHLSVFLEGTILLADVPLTTRIGGADAADSSKTNMEGAAKAPYRKIFASYSHKDSLIVDQFARLAKVWGDEFLRDCAHLRAGEVWSERLLKMIEGADIFQLFWSSNSMLSENVRHEWEHALALKRPQFIRPTYWEDPLPEVPEKNLPPDELRQLHFQRLHFAEGGQKTAVMRTSQIEKKLGPARKPRRETWTPTTAPCASRGSKSSQSESWAGKPLQSRGATQRFRVGWVLLLLAIVAAILYFTCF
jgi:serine/threonine protein kinase